MSPESMISTVVLAVGVLVALGAVVWHWRREGPDPFRRAKVRGSRLTPLAVLAPFGAYVLIAASLGSLTEGLPEGVKRDALRLVVNSLGQVTGAVVCLWAGASCFRGGLRRFVLGRGPWLHQLGTALIYLIAAGSVCEAVALATQQLIHWSRPDQVLHDHRVIDLLRNPGRPPWTPAVLWMGAAVVAPVAEECFFRGLLQTALLRWVRRRWLAVAAPAVVFGLAHHDQPQVVPALTLFGVILGIQYERSGALIGPMALHALFNLKTLTWQWWFAAG